MKKLHIKKGDMVLVISGGHKDRPSNGKYPSPHKVLSVNIDKETAIVEGVNMVSKSTKPSASNPQGGIIKVEGPIHVSNLSLVDPKSGAPTRIAIKREGKKVVRIAKKSGEEIK